MGACRILFRARVGKCVNLREGAYENLRDTFNALLILTYLARAPNVQMKRDILHGNIVWRHIQIPGKTATGCCTLILGAFMINEKSYFGSNL